MSMAAALAVEETGVDVAADLRALRAGKGASVLFAECMDGADDDRREGWRDYVEAVESAALDANEAERLEIERGEVRQ